MSNAPADGNVVPFQHPREEARLRYQDGYGDGAMGSDHDGRAHATLARGGMCFRVRRLGLGMGMRAYMAHRRAPRPLDRERGLPPVRICIAGNDSYLPYISVARKF